MVAHAGRTFLGALNLYESALCPTMGYNIGTRVLDPPTQATVHCGFSTIIAEQRGCGERS